ncbi:MAG: hypothetical protein HC887_07410 [Desulfobacteraceae bacterium]|nr:hypothetical protein [Desulfobacteraceae bacterium]
MAYLMPINLKLPIEFTKKKKWIVASCPVSDIFPQGDTEDDAKKRLSEALNLFLSSCIDRRTLNDILTETDYV